MTTAREAVELPDVDELAQLIRIVDGKRELGAGALADRICEWLIAHPARRASLPSPEASAEATPSAIQALAKALQDDPEYAWALHCNLAMPIMDSLHCTRWDANMAGADLMRYLFDIDIRANRHWAQVPPAFAPSVTPDVAGAVELLRHCLPIVARDAQMMADISRFAPLDAETQAVHDSTEYESEKLAREIPAFLAAIGRASLPAQQAAEGWQCVPKEATEAMRRAGLISSEGYRWMLAVAPPAPVAAVAQPAAPYNLSSVEHAALDRALMKSVRIVDSFAAPSMAPVGTDEIDAALVKGIDIAPMDDASTLKLFEHALAAHRAARTAPVGDDAKDAALLDWIEAQAADGVYVEVSYEGSFSGPNLKRSATVFLRIGEYRAETLREAISAARTAQTGEA